MIKDWKKRKEVGRQAKTRLRLNAMRKSKILPPELIVGAFQFFFFFF